MSPSLSCVAVRATAPTHARHAFVWTAGLEESPESWSGQMSRTPVPRPPPHTGSYMPLTIHPTTSSQWREVYCIPTLSKLFFGLAPSPVTCPVTRRPVRLGQPGGRAASGGDFQVVLVVFVVADATPSREYYYMMHTLNRIVRP